MNSWWRERGHFHDTMLVAWLLVVGPGFREWGRLYLHDVLENGKDFHDHHSFFFLTSVLNFFHLHIKISSGYHIEPL